MVGGGEDGEALTDAFADADFPRDTVGLIVAGPYMPVARRQQLQRLAARRGDLQILDFVPEAVDLLQRAHCVVAMGGYNTVCEILAQRKRALLVPRVKLQRHLRDAAQVITVSDYNVAYLQEQYGEDAAYVHRIYNGLDLAHFPYRAPTLRPRRIVAVGRLVKKKGFADLVTACAFLVRRGCVFTCAIIGDGPLQEPLQAQIAQLGLTDHVRLLGPQPQDVVIRQVQEAAIFATPCVIGEDGNRDGLPTVLLEAMALGTPCVSTDVTGIPEVLHHNRTGLMVPQHDPHALALALEHLLDDPGVRTRLAAAARSQIEEDFDIHRNAATIRQCWGIATRDRQPAAGQTTQPAPVLQQEAAP